MTQIAELIAVVGADITGFQANMNTAQSALGEFASTFGGAGQRVQRFGQQTSAAMLPVAGAMVTGIDAAADFEVVMTQLQTFGGLTAAELETVGALAMQMGADTMFSATDAANAMLELVKSGMSVEQAMIAAESALQLAAVGEMSLAEASSIISASMSQFGLTAEQVPAAVQALAAGASASTAEVTDLAQGLANVGPIASGFGLDINETAAALAVLAAAGIEGAEGGNALKSMLLNMSSDVASTQEAWAELGLSMYDAEGNMLDFQVILSQLDGALAGMSAEEANQILQDLFGSYGIVAGQALLAADGIETMETAMAAAPDAGDIATANMTTFTGVLDSLQGSLETLGITTLTPFIDQHLKPLVENVTEVVNQLTTWAGENPEIASTLGLVATALVVAGPALIGVGFAMQIMAGAAGGLKTALTLVTSPVFILGAAFLAVLIAGGRLDDLITDLTGNFDEAKTAINDIQTGNPQGWTDLGVAIGSIPADILENLAIAAGNLIGIDVEGGLNAWTGVFSMIGTTVRVTVDNIVRDIDMFILTANTTMVGWLQGFRQMILDATGGQVDIAPNLSVDLHGMQSELADMQIADQVTSALQTQLAGGAVDLSQVLTFETAQGTISTSLGALLNNPEVVEAMSQQGRDAISNALALATQTGDQAAYDALVPLALALDIPVAPITAAVSTAIADGVAGVGTTEFAVTVNPVTGTTVTSGFGGQSSGGTTAGAPGAGVPGFATGGMMPYTGLALLHKGERVLNNAETAAYNKGASGGNTFILNAYGQRPFELLDDMQRAARSRGR